MKSGIIAIMSVFVTIAATAVLADPPTSAEIRKSDISGISNFSQFDGSPGFAGARVGFGGATQPSAMSQLKSEGFATVISLRLAGEEGADIDGSRAAAEAAGLNYVHLPFDAKSPAPDLVDTFLATAGDNANQPVYIHCGSATRVAALWMIGRVLVDGLEMDAARKEVEAIAAKPADAEAFATRYIDSHRE